jgi:hypothetical protein
MHCPQCGQHQASEEMRFCSRCGFPLTGIAQLLANGGTLSVDHGDSSCSRLSPRRRGVRRGAILLMLGVVITPLLAILLAPPHGPLPSSMPYLLIPLSAIIFFAGGLMRMLYALLFEERAPAAIQAAKFAPPAVSPIIAKQLNVPARGTAIPSATSAPVTAWKPRQTNTSEIILPASVTENTTRLLKDERD